MTMLAVVVMAASSVMSAPPMAVISLAFVSP